MDLVGPISRAFHLISSSYGWTDEMILNKTLRRIRQLVAVISEEKATNLKQERLALSWQTRSLAMVMAASGANPSEEIMKFASNLTIDNEEYVEFNKQSSGLVPIKSDPKIPVHATTQDVEAQKNFDAAADSNSFEAFGMFGFALENGKPGHN